MFAIKNYGLLWERKHIFWGYSGVSGHLKGYRRGRKEADFRTQAGVYILYDKDLIPIYVGQAGKGKKTLFDRLKNHTNNHLWNRWEYFSWFGLCKANKDGSLAQDDNPERKISGIASQALNDIEGVLILGIEPKLNKQGPNFKGVELWWQSIDPRLEEITNYQLREEIINLKNQIGENRG